VANIGDLRAIAERLSAAERRANRRDQAIVTATYFGRPVARDTIPLSDGAGEVIAVGDGVMTFAPGDRVVATFAQTPPGGPPFVEPEPLGSPLDGTLAVISPEGGGTTLQARLPYGS